ncbi:MAG: hypothetical protein AB7G76_11675 [Steroidobacteraceae bacterium]
MPPTRIERWRSPLILVTLGALLFALLSGSVLLFFGMPRARREYWVLVHWLIAMVALVPYALYQWRHWQRVREHAKLTHYRVGLHSFFMVCGTVLTGLPLVLPLEPGTRAYTIVDLAHIFFGFVFVLLVSAHLTLTAVLTVTRATEGETRQARAAVRRLVVGATVVALVGLVVAITGN